jgi:hypothetical protein
MPVAHAARPFSDPFISTERLMEVSFEVIADRSMQRFADHATPRLL